MYIFVFVFLFTCTYMYLFDASNITTSKGLFQQPNWFLRDAPGTQYRQTIPIFNFHQRITGLRGFKFVQVKGHVQLRLCSFLPIFFFGGERTTTPLDVRNGAGEGVNHSRNRFWIKSCINEDKFCISYLNLNIVVEYGIKLFKNIKYSPCSYLFFVYVKRQIYFIRHVY